MSAMKMLRFAVAASLLVSTSAEAQLFRAYLTATGSDAHPCTLQQPCRLLPAALNAVASGGEIWMLDSANYNSGTVTISKDVSILAVPGVVGSVAATGGPAIAIYASGLTVALRNLVIAPVVTLPAGTFGVYMTGASNLVVEDSLIANLPQDGVVLPSGGNVKIANSTIRNNGGYAVMLGDGARAAISQTQLLANTGGAVMAYAYSTSTTSTASLSDCVVSGGGAGVWAYATATTAVARISVTRSTIQKTTSAVTSMASFGGAADVNVGSSLIVDNGKAWYQEGAGASVHSLGNNQLRGNGASTGVLTPMTPQ